LKEISSKEINAAGQKIMWGYVESKPLPFESNVPTDVCVEDSRLTIPRYVKLDSEKITPGIIRILPVISVPIALGKMCLNISLLSLAPSVLAERTYS
jgi:hypothetical protein